MSHTTNWTCRSCGSTLGHVHDGVLHPTVPVESVDGVWPGSRVRHVTGLGCGNRVSSAPLIRLDRDMEN